MVFCVHKTPAAWWKRPNVMKMETKKYEDVINHQTNKCLIRVCSNYQPNRDYIA
jgi:hypothetical protein